MRAQENTVSIDIKFNLDWREYYAAQRFLAAHRRRTPAERIIAPILAVAGIAAGLISGDLWIAGVAVAIAVIVLFAGPRLRRREIHKRFAREPFHRQEHAVSFDSDGVEYVQGRIVSRYPWNFYERVIESGDAFLLVCGEDAFNLIPKRAFDGNDSVDEFRRLATGKLQNG